MGAKVGGGGRFQLGQNSDINVTPFVDVMLVLLIIFMVALPAATSSIKLDLPKAEKQEHPPAKQPVVVNVQPGGAIFIGDQATLLASLSSDLTRVLAANDATLPPTQQRVYIRADRKVRYGDFMSVINRLQGDGFFQVALINEEL
jgi:biopolymer transport protein ExbD